MAAVMSPAVAAEFIVPVDWLVEIGCPPLEASGLSLAALSFLQASRKSTSPVFSGISPLRWDSSR
jgi:hypothetical protein